MMNKVMQERAIMASMKYLESQGFEDVERFEDNLVGYDQGELVFCEVKLKEKGFGAVAPASTEKRAELEELALRYLVENDIVGVSVRFDELSLIVCGDNRAMVRHYKNCLA